MLSDSKLHIILLPSGHYGYGGYVPTRLGTVRASGFVAFPTFPTEAEAITYALRRGCTPIMTATFPIDPCYLKH